VPAGFWSFAGPLLMLQGTSTLLLVIGLHLKRPQLCGHSLEHWNGILVLVALWTIVTGTVLIMNLNTSPTTTEPYSGNWTDLTRDLTRRGRSVLGDAAMGLNEGLDSVTDATSFSPPGRAIAYSAKSLMPTSTTRGVASS
jgi:hypothetical protein